MKFTFLILILTFISTSCVTNKPNNQDQSTYERPYNQIIIGTNKSDVIKKCGEPFKTELKNENGTQTTHMLFKIKNKKTIFKIIFKSDKVIKVLRYDDSLDKNDVKIIN
jgi:hypothetical protein